MAIPVNAFRLPIVQLNYIKCLHRRKKICSKFSLLYRSLIIESSVPFFVRLQSLVVFQTLPAWHCPLYHIFHSCNLYRNAMPFLLSKSVSIFYCNLQHVQHCFLRVFDVSVNKIVVCLVARKKWWKIRSGKEQRLPVRTNKEWSRQSHIYF